MKTLIITLTAACAAVAVYFGFRYFTCRDLGFTPVRKYVRNVAENLLQTKINVARAGGTPPEPTTEQAV